MNRADIRTLLCDYLDGLLEGDELEAAEAYIARHPEAVAEVARFRAVLYRPYPVAPPSPEQADAIWRRHVDRPAWRWARYAAVFLAGVLATLIVQSGARPASAPTPALAHVEQPAPPLAETAPTFNRRIR